jgi:hypothetical protein
VHKTTLDNVTPGNFPQIGATLHLDDLGLDILGGLQDVRTKELIRVNGTGLFSH